MENIRKLIAADKLERAIDQLYHTVYDKDDDISNQLVEFQATLTKNKKDSRRGLISSQQEDQTRTRVRYGVLEMLNEIQDMTDSEIAPRPDRPDDSPTQPPTKAKRPKVFISYNHADREVTEKLKIALEASRIDVRIDWETMKAGENISAFIERSITDTDVTLSVISNKSLLSAWVAMETIETFYHEKFNHDKKFIACYIDDDFFQTRFRLDATKQIDARIEEIDQQIPEYIQMKIDTIDLNSEKSRLHKLRSNLGDYILRLRDSLTLDVREGQFAGNVAKIISTIQDSN